jgi:hypothetical protein
VAIQEQDKLHDLLASNPQPEGFEELRKMLAAEEEIPDDPDPKDSQE